MTNLVTLLQRQIGAIGSFQDPFSCPPGDMNSAAAALDDLATLIQEIGIDVLQQELGINLYSVFDFN